MSRRALWASLIGYVVVVGALFGVMLGVGQTPVLGLDLRGGISVIFAPTEPATSDDLIVIRDMMRDQLEEFGIAEPDVRVEGENIVVDLPGVTDQDEALAAVEVSGIVTLRPVLSCQAGLIDTDPDATTTLPPTTINLTPIIPSTAPVTTLPTDTGTLESTGSSDNGSDTNTDTGSDTSTGTDPTDAEESAAGPRPLGFRSPNVPDSTAPTTTAPSTTVPATTAPTTTAAPTTTLPVETTPSGVTTTTLAAAPTSEPFADGSELLPYPGAGQTCLVGPSTATGDVVFERGSAQATIDQSGQWVVAVDLAPEGEQAWNDLAAQCYSGVPTCPPSPVSDQGRGQLAIVLDDVIQSAPVVEAPSFDGTVTISGSFDKEAAENLETVLKRGAFPIDVEPQKVETISATAGSDALGAAVVAGLVGLAAMLVVLIAYYRRLAVVIVAGLTVWSMTVFVLTTWVSNQTNYALTLAGVTGIIISVGVTVDTYVVYFERLRDEVRHGRSVRNAAPRSYTATWKTVLAADFVSLLGSIVLFALSVGSVKGFALYLGLTTVCDLLVFVLFTRPAVILLARTGWLDSAARSRSDAAIGASS